MRVRASLIKDNAKKNIKKVLAGDENKIARLAKKAYVGVDGVAKLFWGGSQEEEQEPVFLNYIESTGSQYIDTGIVPKLTHTYKIKFEFTQIGTNQVMFGSRSTGSSYNSLNQIYLNCNNYEASIFFLAFFRGLERENRYTNVSANTIYTEEFVVNDPRYSISSNFFDNSATLPSYLFAFNALGNAIAYSYIRLYGFEIYDGSTLIRDFRPYKDANGVICLYDLVEKKCYYNKGTGSFTGEMWEPTQLKYIENVDKQYIDTGFKPNQDTTVEIKMLGTKARAYWFGAWNETYKDGAYSISNDDYNLYFGYDGQYYSHDIIASDTEHVVKMDKNIAYIDGQIFKNFTYTAFQVNYNLYLFSQNRKGTAFFWEDGLGDTYKLASCKIYDNGILVRDFVPALDQNNVAGLWDKVNKKFYYNQGSGTFNAGPVVV